MLWAVWQYYRALSVGPESPLMRHSDYLAELAALPQSGVSEVESTIALPSDFNTHDSAADEEYSALYFLACISMRGLLNRVHNLLYAKESGASLDDARFPALVSELNHQLEEWRDCLPPAYRFSVDTEPTENQHGGFLRQRYLTYKSVIYRPYLTWALAYSQLHTRLQRTVTERCQACLDACLLHALNLQSFAHTVMVDTWICSLSYVKYT
jgi:hypothetical protein